MRKYTYSKLRGRIKEYYNTQEKFAEKLGVSPLTVSKKLHGKTEFSQSDVEKWAKLLHIIRWEYGDMEERGR